MRRLAATARAHPWPMSLAGSLVACLLSMLFVDRPLAVFLAGHTSDDLRAFFRVWTTLGLSQIWLVPSGVAALGLLATGIWAGAPERRARGRRWAAAAGYFFVTVAGSGLLVDLIKVVVGRDRPRLPLDSGLYGFHPLHVGYAVNSFPSGHAQTIWAAMVALWIMVPRYDLMWLAIAVIVSLSRVIITVHYLSDVLFGAYLGIAGSLWLRTLWERKGLDLRLPWFPRSITT